MKVQRICLAASVVVLLSGCGTVGLIRDEIDKEGVSSASIFSQLLKKKDESRVVERDDVYMPAKKVKAAKDGEWLKLHKVQLEIRQAVSLRAVVEMLSEQGVNVSSSMPLDSYSYVGKINATDAKTALQAILSTVGLDYQTDDERRIVIIKPMSSRTWYLDIGNRRSSYSGELNSSKGTTNTFVSNGSGRKSFENSSPSLNSTDLQNKTDEARLGGGTGVETEDNFWGSLENELKSRLNILIPQERKNFSGEIVLPTPIASRPGSPLPQLNRGEPQKSSEFDQGYARRLIGTYSLNAETGAITVQAPHWILQDLDSYFKRVTEMYNTDISFSGEIVLVTSEKSDSEGFDVSGFTKWLTRNHTGVLAIANNSLGGITMSVPNSGTSGPAIQGLGQSGAKGPVIGYSFTGEKNALDIFNAYLAELGKVSVVQRPVVTTTSGVPGVFSKKYTDYYNTVTQQAASGGSGSAVTATQNILVPVEMGTELIINPRIDVGTGLIRAQIRLNQIIQSGVKVLPQVITYGNNTSTVETSVPLLTKQNISGEVLLRDGDLIVVGGQTEKSLSTQEIGIPGDVAPIGGVFGNKKGERGSQTYYFALKVSVNKRN